MAITTRRITTIVPHIADCSDLVSGVLTVITLLAGAHWVPDFLNPHHKLHTRTVCTTNELAWGLDAE